jgi:hypothetical protein
MPSSYHRLGRGQEPVLLGPAGGGLQPSPSRSTPSPPYPSPARGASRSPSAGSAEERRERSRRIRRPLTARTPPSVPGGRGRGNVPPLRSAQLRDATRSFPLPLGPLAQHPAAKRRGRPPNPSPLPWPVPAAREGARLAPDGGLRPPSSDRTISISTALQAPCDGRALPTRAPPPLRGGGVGVRASHPSPPLAQHPVPQGRYAVACRRQAEGPPPEKVGRRLQHEGRA